MTSTNGRDGRGEASERTVARPSRRQTDSDQPSRRRRDGRDGRDGRAARADGSAGQTGRLLTVGEAADRLGTTVRFPRRLIAERRITFVKLGSHVRIPEMALDDFIAASTVEPAE